MLRLPILVVDDDHDASTALAALIAARGTATDLAHDAEAALALVTQRDYALAILDYQMPDVDGLQLFGRLRQVRAELTGVLFAGVVTPELAARAVGAGFSHVLWTLTDLPELLAIVESHSSAGS
jgi:DNA-binding response OmpR family regulator